MEQVETKVQSADGDTQGMTRTSWSLNEWEIVSGPLHMQSWDTPHQKRKHRSKHGAQF